MAAAAEIGDKIIEGKTKVLYKYQGSDNLVLMQSKDEITCGDGARKDTLEGKAKISNQTIAAVYEFLNKAGIKTHFVSKKSDNECIVKNCAMIPIEFVTRRLATGSFLKRMPGVKEGFRFPEPKLEYFFKDDANHDPQWSREQILEEGFDLGGLKIGRWEVDELSSTTVAVFEILEKAWASLGCVLVDMKIEFGVDIEKKEIVLADVIDNDSWRLWPAGDKRLMRDKQVYRNLKEVTCEAMQEIKKNYQWVADKAVQFMCKPSAKVVIMMGSPTDKEHCAKIKNKLDSYAIPCDVRITSAHKGTEETIRILREYESYGIPLVFIAVAGRSNGLGPVLSGNTSYPVINCPPIKADWGHLDIWSSLRLPSGLGCTTVTDPTAAAMSAAQILGMTDHVIWSKLRAERLNTAVKLMHADQSNPDRQWAAEKEEES